MKRIIHIIMLAAVALGAQALTLEECQRLARANYPLIRQQDLIARTAEYDIDNIGKAWLPRVQAYGQATLQSAVTELPDAFQTVLRQQGMEAKGISPFQYRVGVDVDQTVWEGGNIASQKEIARRTSEVQQAQNEVTLYGVRERVNDLYFAVLLIEDQMRLHEDMITLLRDTERKIASMVKHGTASNADLANIQAERVKAEQQHTQLQNSRHSYARVLALFIGKEPAYVTNLQKPVATQVTGQDVARPELTLLDKRLALLDARQAQIKAGLMPRVSAFAQGFAGYLGYNMFRDMFHRSPTFNGLIGVRVSWNIGNLYTRRNDEAKLELQRSDLAAQRETFLLNNRLQSTMDEGNLAGYRQMLADDDTIINLRQTVRKAAQSKLNHGIIDVNDLLKEITTEHQARIAKSTHELEMLKTIYDLRNTVNQ